MTFSFLFSFIKSLNADRCNNTEVSNGYMAVIRHFPMIDRYTKDAQIQSPESASLGSTSGEVLLPKSGLELGKS